jgi:uncharacterized protein YoaH (UPF0181 family)
MMIITERALVVTTHGRVVALQQITATERFQALLAFGVSSGRASAVVSGLATLREEVRPIKYAAANT